MLVMGHSLDDIGIAEAYDTVRCALTAPMPIIGSIDKFYPWLKEEKKEKIPLETGIKIKHGEKNIVKNVRSAEQYLALVNAGYANKG